MIGFLGTDMEEQQQLDSKCIDSDGEKQVAEMIIKARIDKREYRRIVLPNCLEVLLISDPETDRAAASMDVSVGSFNDPKGLEGLAHFLEHMLFYASEKYPLEEDFNNYIEGHGGYTNAYTNIADTNYYFDIHADYLGEALDRFAQFFIKPLISSDATSREINAVDSEHQNSLSSVAFRSTQLQQHICNEDHPFHRFGTGNLETLEIRPKQKGLDIRNEVIKFYEENYSANLMHLVVYGKESLDQLQRLVEQKFQEIPNTNRKRFRYPGKPCMAEHLQILVKAVPVQEGDTLRMIWPVTPDISHYKQAPLDYLQYIINNQGEGCFFHTLKKLGWATKLSAGEGIWLREFSFFQVDIDLTDAGHEHMEDIVGLMFRYILLLQKRGVKKWIFDEFSAICWTDFHYQEKLDPSDYVSQIAEGMDLYPPKDWLVASLLPSTFNPNSIKMVLDELSPKNVRIFWESKKFEKHTNMVEPWYGTAYSVQKLTSSIIQQWITNAPDELIGLPKPNVFIPTDLSLHVQEWRKDPFPLKESSFSRLWYKTSTLVSIPKAYAIIGFNCPYTRHSPQAKVLTDIFTRLLSEDLEEYTYDAQVAGLSYSIKQTIRGFEVIVDGFNHKLKILVDKVLEKIAEFKVKPDRFSVIKETVTKVYHNFKYKQPYKQARFYCSLILEENSWAWSDLLEILPGLGPDDLTNFLPLMFSKTFIECYVTGNMQIKEAESMILHIENLFFKGPGAICGALLPSEYFPNTRVVKLESGMSYFYQMGVQNESDSNSALVHYIQIHQDDISLNVKLKIFYYIANQPAFHQLRTVEQLGFITELRETNHSGIRGLQFHIQSKVKDPEQIRLRVEAFLKEFESKVYGMTDEEFRTNVSTLLNVKGRNSNNLADTSVFYWREIVDGTMKFDRSSRERVALESLTHQEFMNFFSEYIKVDAPGRKTLTIQVYGHAHSSEFETAKSENLQPQSIKINDIHTFRRSQSRYGSFREGIVIEEEQT